MNGLLTISLENLRFRAHHGLYEEEKKTGNEFEINLKVFYPAETGSVNSIHDTINYVTLYELLQTSMEHPRELLETLAMDITAAIHTAWPQLTALEITIEKLSAPIAKFRGNVSVTYRADWRTNSPTI
jgi:dihydroneopterin aldolase